MKVLVRILILFFLCSAPAMLYAQEAKPAAGQSGENNTPLSKTQKRAAKKKWKEQRKKERAEKRMIKKHHKRIQEKSTLKRMKKDKKRAINNNEGKREFFLKRWFSRKQKGKIN